MSTALAMLCIGRLTAAEANALSDRLAEEDGTAALAVTLNEVDEASGEWEVIAYYATEDEARHVARRTPNPGAAISIVPDIDWVRRSLEGLSPVATGRFFIHGAHDRARRRGGGISLEIDAGTAFGTGHHATTLGCLAALDRLLKARAPRRILDLGCGTGVLALAVAKARHVPVLASDIDPVAVAVAAGNARRNGAAPLLRTIAAAGVADRRIAAAAPYDLIFANILAGPLIALAAPLARLLAAEGRIVLSGLTRDQERAVFAAYRQHGLVREGRDAGGNWMALTLKRAPKQNARPLERSGRSSNHRDRFRDARLVGA